MLPIQDSLPRTPLVRVVTLAVWTSLGLQWLSAFPHFDVGKLILITRMCFQKLVGLVGIVSLLAESELKQVSARKTACTQCIAVHVRTARTKPDNSRHTS